MTNTILQAGIQGIQGGLDQFGRASRGIATPSNSSSTNNTLAENVVDVKQAERTVETSAKVVSVADSIVGTLLDELA